jgi:hypothetical protein
MTAGYESMHGEVIVESFDPFVLITDPGNNIQTCGQFRINPFTRVPKAKSTPDASAISAI